MNDSRMTNVQHDRRHLPEDILQASHSDLAIRARLTQGPDHSYLKDSIYGAIDGAVTTFAVVSGVAGAGLDTSIILILGAANLLGDGFSMAASNFLGTQAEEQQRSRLRKLEEEHIERIPEGERQEIYHIMERQGFKGEDLDRAVEVITSDRERWVETMLREEHGVPLTTPTAWKAALATFLSFVIVGLLPLLPFLFETLVSLPASAYLLSTLMTSVAFFAVGAIKSRFVEEHWLQSGLETLAVGGIAAGLAYYCGLLVESVL